MKNILKNLNKDELIFDIILIIFIFISSVLVKNYTDILMNDTAMIIIIAVFSLTISFQTGINFVKLWYGTSALEQIRKKEKTIIVEKKAIRGRFFLLIALLFIAFGISFVTQFSFIMILDEADIKMSVSKDMLYFYLFFVPPIIIIISFIAGFKIGKLRPKRSKGKYLIQYFFIIILSIVIVQWSKLVGSAIPGIIDFFYDIENQIIVTVGLLILSGILPFRLLFTLAPPRRKTNIYLAIISMIIFISMFILSAMSYISGIYIDRSDINTTYKIVNIGDQTWFVENYINHISDGIYYPKTIDETYSLKDSKYGFYYDWKNATTACPDGYHLPTDEDWTELVCFLGGKELAIEKLKSSENWILNMGNNLSGFTARPGGFFNYNSGNFFGEGQHALWWTSTPTSIDSTNAWIRIIDFENNKIYKDTIPVSNGLSVRCLKD